MEQLKKTSQSSLETDATTLPLGNMSMRTWDRDCSLNRDDSSRLLRHFRLEEGREKQGKRGCETEMENHPVEIQRRRTTTYVQHVKSQEQSLAVKGTLLPVHHIQCKITWPTTNKSSGRRTPLTSPSIFSIQITLHHEEGELDQTQTGGPGLGSAKQAFACTWTRGKRETDRQVLH